jgi:hypothetical protein
MNREYRLGFCQTCTKRGMNPKFGIVCSLTNEPADFDLDCIDYNQSNKEFNELLQANKKSISIFSELESNNPIKLSSSWSMTSFYLSATAVLTPIIGLTIGGILTGFHTNILIGLAVLALFGFIILYLLSQLTIASIRDRKIYLKRLFGSENIFEFTSIKDISSFQLKTTKYITCKIKTANGTEDSYTIMNSKHLLSFEKRDAESILIAAKNYNLSKGLLTLYKRL